jgi:pyruvate dehydrogenase E2 component (dihydrolipoamide acetyltransferase)
MATKIYLPRLGESVEEAAIGCWLKSVGDPVKRGDVIAELETAKAMMELESPVNGVLLAVFPELGKTIQMGELVAIVGKAGEDWKTEVSEDFPVTEKRPEMTALPKEKSKTTGEYPAQRLRITPNAKRMAREKGISLLSISNKQSGERITAVDVQGMAATNKNTPFSGVPFVVVELNTVEKMTAERLQESINTIPQFSVSIEVDATRLMKKIKNINKDAKHRVTLTALLIKRVAKVLKDHPRLNAVYENGKVLCYQHMNIAFAVATDDGLYVPVIHQADQLNIDEISKRMNNLAEACKIRKIEIKDMSDGTFTISNLGMKKVRQFVPIIDPSQSAILGVGEVYEDLVMIKTGKIKTRKKLILTLTCDHRIIDGVSAADFLSQLQDVLESKG